MSMVPEKRKDRLLEMVGNTPAKSKSSIKHAWVHIDKAKALVDVDNEMAAFRAITAEEEAATGIILALQDIGYERSNLLSPRNHKHKSGLWHLLMIISAFIHEVGVGELLKGKVAEGNGENVGKLVISFPSPISGDSRWVTSVPPLNISISADGKNISFQKQVEELASIKNKNALEKYISQEANLRNELIYASPEGLPSVMEAPTSFISEREKRVMVLTYAYLLISQYREQQRFVQQSLDAYLRILRLNQAGHLHHAL
jgi:hypothetical protein